MKKLKKAKPRVERALGHLRELYLERAVLDVSPLFTRTQVGVDSRLMGERSDGQIIPQDSKATLRKSC